MNIRIVHLRTLELKNMALPTRKLPEPADKEPIPVNATPEQLRQMWELIIERTKEGRAAARARGRNCGTPYKMAPSKLRLAVASMNQPETNIGDLCAEPGITLRMRRVDPTDARNAERFPLREHTETGRVDTVRTFSRRCPRLGSWIPAADG
jgi:hypothetical protein